MSNEKNIQEPEKEPLKEKQENITNDNRTILQKLRYIKSNITVEPIFAGLVIASTLSKLAIQNLNLDKSCRVKLNFGDDICDSLIHKTGNVSDIEARAQKVISDIETWKSVIQTSLPTILVIFMGAWSDRTGNRKFCILLPIIGELLVCVSNIVSTLFFYQVSVEITMLLEGIFPALSGGWVLLYIGVFSYISDITDEESRTFRVGMANLCLTAGVPIGTSLSGILLKLLGYYGVFTISGLIYLLTFFYGLFYLKNNTKPQMEEKEKDKSVGNMIEAVNLVKETAQVAFKKRGGNLRMKLIMTLSVVAIIYGPNHGERLVTYLFTRYRLKWDALRYSIYSTYSLITHCLGALFSISVFSKRWGFHDSMLCLISILSKLAGSLTIAFVFTDFQMYMVPLVEILNATTFTSLRSMASKLVPSEEMGKINSLFSLVETLAALVFDPIYTTLYSNTIKIFTGAVFIFSAFMTLPAISILIWLFIRHRIETMQQKAQTKLDNLFQDLPSEK